MSEKRPTKDKSVADAPQPVLAQKLFAAINEHEAVLARVSRLLHDDVSQILSAVGLQLDAMRMDFREQAPGWTAAPLKFRSCLNKPSSNCATSATSLTLPLSSGPVCDSRSTALAGKVRSNFPGTLRLHFDASLRVPTILAKAFYKMTECALENAIVGARLLADRHLCEALTR